MSLDCRYPEGLHKLECRIPATLELKRDNATATIRHIFFLQLVIWAALKAGVIYFYNLRMLFQEFCNSNLGLALTPIDSMDPVVDVDTINAILSADDSYANPY